MEATMPQRKLPAVFMRGGTSKAVIFHARDLPAARAEWEAIFLAVIGSPDPNFRQLDGMGGGVSSLSKVCVIAPATRPDADIDYTFAQVLIDKPRVDYNSNCGNMSAAVGPFAIDEGLVAKPASGEAVVRIHNTNTRKIIVARFPMDGAEAAVAGAMTLDGVSGSGAPVRLEFLEPGGAKTGRLLPTGAPRDLLEVDGLGRVTVSLVDAANPCVFVPAEALGASTTLSPTEIERDAALLAKLEAVRRAGSVAMGIAPDRGAAAGLSVPFVAMVGPPAPMTVLSGRRLAADDMDIAVRMMSNGQAHRATPLTGALCLAVATRVADTTANERARRALGANGLRIGHASGITVVDARLKNATADREPEAEYAAVYRTARRLFEGRVLFQS
jgi:2-methylaconitate cis-trans-isomerase PrpF